MSGTLTIDNGRVELEVIGDFGRELLSETATSKAYSLRPADQPRLLGLSSDGKSITLERVSSGARPLTGLDVILAQ